MDAVELELFTNRFRALVTEMGTMLQRTSISTNVKERLDFSCALLDAGGELIVNAPHIPVHLGALGLCVRQVSDTLTVRKGDVIVTNHPGVGGSHLPDISVIAPVHDGDVLVGYVANRAHHAEIGGSAPGSMPPRARRLSEEGVVIKPFRLFDAGRPGWDEMRALLLSGPFPSRAPEENLADLHAAVAANERGRQLLLAMARSYGRATVTVFMERIKANSAERAGALFTAWADREIRAEEKLDDGAVLAVKTTIDGGSVAFDFTGTSAKHPGNLNATPAIVRSAVLYVIRLLLQKPLPLNEGLLRAVKIHLPPCMLNPGFDPDPEKAPAVVGGNVETSQRLVDLLLKPFGVIACGQGTMNNVLFGDADFGYYETVCGGSGAGPDFDGADAVHTHMTNTRITDPEIIESRYPVRIEKFKVRRGSGGAGTNRGGDGVVREYTFLAPMQLSIVSQHRSTRPYGLEGGDPGKAGGQTIQRASGESVSLGAVDGCSVEPGDRLILKTPGGGGFGGVKKRNTA